MSPFILYLLVAVALAVSAANAWRNPTAPAELRARLTAAAALAALAAFTAEPAAIVLAAIALVIAAPMLVVLSRVDRAHPHLPRWVRLAFLTAEARRHVLAAWTTNAAAAGRDPAPQPELQGQDAILAAAGHRDHHRVLALAATTAEPADPALNAARAQAVTRALDLGGAADAELERRLDALRAEARHGRVTSAAVTDAELRVLARAGDDRGTDRAITRAGRGPGTWPHAYWVGRALLERGVRGDARAAEDGVNLLAAAYQKAPAGPSGDAVRADVQARLARVNLVIQAPARPAGAAAGITAWGTWALLAALAAADVLESLATGRGLAGLLVTPSVDTMLALGGNYAPLSVAGGEWWRFLTSTLLHAGPLHLAMNAYALWIFGPAVEARAGRAALFLAFVVTGVAGSVASSYFGAHEAVSVGASGAIFGLVGFSTVHGATTPEAWRQRLRVGLPNLVMLLLLSAIIPNVDNFGHIGGAVAGLALGFAYHRPPLAARAALGALAVAALAYALWRVAANAFASGLIR